MSTNQKSHKLGTLQQYKTEYFGRFIPTNYRDTPEYTVVVNEQSRLVSVRKMHEGFEWWSTGGKWSCSTITQTVILFQVPIAVPLSGPTPKPPTFELECIPPWKFRMPWTYHNELLVNCQTNEYALEAAQFPRNNSVPLATLPKLTLMPVDSVTFDIKLRNISCGQRTYLECLVYGVPNKEDMPYKFWVDETWLEPHTGKTTEEETKERIGRILGKIKKKYGLEW